MDSDQYSAFDRTGLADELRRRRANRVWVCGLALDVCVKATAPDSVAAGFPTILVTSACAPVNPEGGAAALDDAEVRTVRQVSVFPGAEDGGTSVI